MADEFVKLPLPVEPRFDHSNRPPRPPGSYPDSAGVLPLPNGGAFYFTAAEPIDAGDAVEFDGATGLVRKRRVTST